MQLKCPNTIPSEMLYDNGMNRMQMKAGMASEQLLKSIFNTEPIIMRPTNTNTGVVAAAGIARNNGAKNSANRKQAPVTKAVSPLRPPSFTPAALSTYTATVLVPMAAPAAVEIESTINTSFSLGILPSAFIMPARLVTPITVPIQSNKSTKSRVNTMITMSLLRI